MKAEPKHVKRESILLFSVVTIGVSSAIFQLLALREFLNVFYGNELIFGIILSNWLLLTGIGSYLGRFLEKTKNKIYLFVILQTIIAIIPMVTIFAVRLMKTYAIMPGEITSTANIIFLSFFLLAPYCLLSGFLLILACSLLSLKRDSRQIGKIYISDSVGSIAGGMIFSLLLVFFFTPFQNTAFLLIIVLLSGIFIIASNKKLKYVILLSSFLLASLIISLSFNADLETTRGMYPGQEIIFHGSSPYGNIVITEMENQINFYENGIFLFSTNDTISAEQKVHYAMVQHKNPKSILLISGGVSGTINEILKYRPNKIDYVELDPLLIDAGKKYANLSESKIVRLIISDGRVFVKTTDSKYDVVIIDLPDPSNAQINRFYTIEFFRELKNILNEGGIVSLSISSSENYMSIETSILNSVIYNTLKSVFNNVIIIPSGDENFFIASEYNLSTQISSLIENKGIKTKFVNRDYLKASLSEERLIYAEKLIKNQNTTINLDFNPIAYYYYIIFWESQFNLNFLPLIIIAILILAFLLFKMKPVELSIAATGFASSSAEIIIILAFQIIYGYSYQYIGIIIASFMAGLAIGAFLANRNISKKTKNHLVIAELSIFIFFIILPDIIYFISSIKDQATINVFSSFSFPTLTIIIATLAGYEFPIASKLHNKSKKIEHAAGAIYASDFLGAAIGALITSVFFIPVLGFENACIIAGILNLIAGLLVLKS